MTHPSPRAHVFIVTYGRSGSTLTQSLLNTLPGYQIRGENGNLAWFLARAVDVVRRHEMFADRRRDAALPPEQRDAYLDMLRDSFAGTRFLFQTRDLDAVARSGWWAQQPREQVIAQLRRAEALFADYAAARPAACFTIRHERYREGADYVAEILGFLGERMDRLAIEAALARSLSH